MKILDPIVPLATICVLFFWGCDTTEPPVTPPPARLLTTTPLVSEIERFTPEVLIVFDKPVSEVKVNRIDAAPKSSPAYLWRIDLTNFEQIHPARGADFPQTQFCFTVNYTDESGSHQETLDCVEFPEIHAHATVIPIKIISGTVKDGDTDVDANLLNAYGFKFEFNKTLTGSLDILSSEQFVFAGHAKRESLNWLFEWSEDRAGKSVRLYRKPSRGERLLKGQTYTITLDVRDGHGIVIHPTHITFTTKA